jgi:hypothetical protein
VSDSSIPYPRHRFSTSPRKLPITVIRRAQLEAAMAPLFKCSALLLHASEVAYDFVAHPTEITKRQTMKDILQCAFEESANIGGEDALAMVFLLETTVAVLHEKDLLWERGVVK